MTELGQANRTRYHHGDLRQALLDAARTVLRNKGAAALTLRGVAREAQVSHAAPYHHFADKSALLAAVAEEGFRTLLHAVEEQTAAIAQPSLALQEAAVTYVAFAVSNPELYRVMFTTALADKSPYPDLQAAVRAMYDVIGKGLEHPKRDNATREGGTEYVAMAAWALVHGLSMQLIDRQLGLDETPEADIKQLARLVTDVLWTGIEGMLSGHQ